MFVTRDEAIRASRARSPYVHLAEADLRKSASTPLSTTFDIFLSHSSEDAEVIAGVKALIEREGLTVYVDWVNDAQTDRSRVTPATADLLRTRMNHSHFLAYASSRASSNSKWMPWELGYFDGKKPGRVGILPIVATSNASFVGLEYLGLYPLIERLAFTRGGTRFGRKTGTATGDDLRTLART